MLDDRILAIWIEDGVPMTLMTKGEVEGFFRLILRSWGRSWSMGEEESALLSECWVRLCDELCYIECSIRVGQLDESG